MLSPHAFYTGMEFTSLNMRQNSHSSERLLPFQVASIRYCVTVMEKGTYGVLKPFKHIFLIMSVRLHVDLGTRVPWKPQASGPLGAGVTEL